MSFLLKYRKPVSETTVGGERSEITTGMCSVPSVEGPPLDDQVQLTLGDESHPVAESLVGAGLRRGGRSTPAQTAVLETAPALGVQEECQLTDNRKIGEERIPGRPREFRGEFVAWTPDCGPYLTSPFALDVETALISEIAPWELPNFVLAAAFDGHRGCFIERGDLAAFVGAHRDGALIMHNAPFDLAVIHREAPAAGIYDWVEAGRVYDTQLLHRLYMLAKTGETAGGKGESTLETCVALHLNVNLAKDLEDSQGNEVRLSYGRWLGRLVAEIETVYLEYLANDVVITFDLFQILRARLSEQLSRSSPAWGFVSLEWLEEQMAQWGPSTHHIQLKSAIVLKEISRNGLCIDRSARDEYAKGCRDTLEAHREQLAQAGYAAGPGSGLRLQEKVAGLAGRYPDKPFARTSTGKFQTDRQALEDYAKLDPFFQHLQAFKEKEKLLTTFLEKMDRRVLHPSFDVLKTTGRTSSFGEINAQNLPRDNRVRGCIVPSAGHVFVDADYSAVELVTLSQSCISQFGLESHMARAINTGLDLHRIVAARVAGKPPEEITKEERQHAKPINFGKPGGMGDAALKEYARDSYGIELTDMQVSALTTAYFDMFPEMRDFLKPDEDVGQLAAEFFGLTGGGFAECTGNPPMWCSADEDGGDAPDRILGGMCLKVLADPAPTTHLGRPYAPAERCYFWDQVRKRLHDLPDEVQADVRDGVASPRLRESVRNYVSRRGVFTLTGRLRGAAAFCARHNTVFQGLAADGAKLALWDLWRAGYRIVNFIHDGYLIEVPEDSDLNWHKDEITRILVRAMRQVVPDVRVSVETEILRRWAKGDKEARIELPSPASRRVQAALPDENPGPVVMDHTPSASPVVFNAC